MKRKGLLILGLVMGAAVLSGAAALLFLFPGLLPHDEAGPRDALSADEIGLLREGDIILRRGTSAASDLITSVVGEGLGLSHCALVAWRDDGPWVIHTLNGSLTGTDGVQTQPLAEFFVHAAPDTLVVVRPRMDAAALAKSVGAARASLEAGVPFDNAYRLDDSSALYCSELITVALETGGLYPAGYRYPTIYQYLSFTLFFDPERFEPVLSHNPAATARAAAMGFRFP